MKNCGKNSGINEKRRKHSKIPEVWYWFGIAIIKYNTGESLERRLTTFKNARTVAYAGTV